MVNGKSRRARKQDSAPTRYLDTTSLTWTQTFSGDEIERKISVTFWLPDLGHSMHDMDTQNRCKRSVFRS